MNREIKFRAWDTVNKKWLFGYDLLGGFGLIGEVVLMGELNTVGLADWNTIEIMQYTGFRAASRKRTVEEDIYEGDLFRGTEETDLGDIVKYYVVMWIPQRAAFYLVPADHYQVIKNNDVSGEPEFSWLFDDAALYDFSHDIGLTKVGNVYQHEHLMP